MNDSVLLSDTPGRDQAPEGATSATEAPSRAALARDAIRRMLNDEDVRTLPQDVQASVRAYAFEIALFARWHSNVRIAIFGDAEEESGEIVLSDRSNRREMQVSIHSGGGTAFWLSGEGGKIKLADKPVESVEHIVARFETL